MLISRAFFGDTVQFAEFVTRRGREKSFELYKQVNSYHNRLNLFFNKATLWRYLCNNQVKVYYIVVEIALMQNHICTVE